MISLAILIPSSARMRNNHDDAVTEAIGYTFIRTHAEYPAMGVRAAPFPGLHRTHAE